MRNKSLAALAAVGLVAGLATVPATAVVPAAPAYDNPYDIRIAKRMTVRAFYNISYSSQRNICELFETRTVYIVRKLGRTAYRNTPQSVSLREAQKGVIYGLHQVC